MPKKDGFLSGAELTRWIVDLDTALESCDALLYIKKKIIENYSEQVEIFSSQKSACCDFDHNFDEMSGYPPTFPLEIVL